MRTDKVVDMGDAIVVGYPGYPPLLELRDVGVALALWRQPDSRFQISDGP